MINFGAKRERHPGVSGRKDNYFSEKMDKLKFKIIIILHFTWLQ